MKLTLIYSFFFSALLYQIINTIGLDSLALQTGTDKSSSGHFYTKIYEKYFTPLKDKPLNLLEIGFSTGASALLWDQYFLNPDTNLYFIDLGDEYFKKLNTTLSTRCRFHIADQENKNALVHFVNTYNVRFDLIIDDGGHTMKQQKNSFEALWPFVKSGGIYIIEDLHTSYWKEWGGGGDCHNPIAKFKTTVNLLQTLVSDLGYIGAKTLLADYNKCPQHILNNLSVYQKEVESIHVYNSIVFIFKR